MVAKLIKKWARWVLQDEWTDMVHTCVLRSKEASESSHRAHRAERRAERAAAHLSTQFSPLAERAREVLATPALESLHECARVMLAMTFHVASLDRRGPGITSPFSRWGVDCRLDPDTGSNKSRLLSR